MLHVLWNGGRMKDNVYLIFKLYILKIYLRKHPLIRFAHQSVRLTDGAREMNCTRLSKKT